MDFDFFDWNENAKDFSELEFEVDGEFEVKDFDGWLKSNFSKEYEALKIIWRGVAWGGGFEDYVISCMKHHFMGDGIFTDYDTQIIRFNRATTI